MASNNFFKQSGKGSQQAARAVAKIVRDESLEFVKSARQQVTGESSPNQTEQKPQVTDPQIPSELEKQNRAIETTRRLEKLEAEIKQIRDQKKAKEQAFAQQAEQQKVAQMDGEQSGLQEPSTKRKRGMLGAMGKAAKGMKGKLQDLKRKSEIRMPPSG